MSSVSAMSLDDAVNPATPMTNGVISEMLRQFALLSDISQGSVATIWGVVGSLAMVLFQIFSRF